VLIYTGHTIHIVPDQYGAWNVVDLQRRPWPFPTKASALHYAKRIAAANPPSQVVVFDQFGRMETAAHFQLPQYQIPQSNGQRDSSLFEATVKSLVIGGLVAAGIGVLNELVNRVERDLKKASARSKSPHARKLPLREA